MKSVILTVALLLLTTPLAAQDIRLQSRRQVSIWWYSESDYGYGGYGGYGYRPFFPNYRYQLYQPPMQYVPMNWGAIPGYQVMGSGTNGYFIPGW